MIAVVVVLCLEWEL